MKNRLIVSGVFVFLVVIAYSGADAQDIGANVASFAQSRLKSRVGGGESTHLATEALRVAGGEFIPNDLGADNPSSGDYVWGTLVTVISFEQKSVKDSMPGNFAQPGDLIQYRNATFTSAKKQTESFAQHTSVVAQVNSIGRPTSVYQQNHNGNRTIESSAIDVTQLTAGWIRIYRPIPRSDTSTTWKFTITNKTASLQSYSILVGTQAVFSGSLTEANTAKSFMVHKIVTTGTLPAIIWGNDQSCYVENPKGMEFILQTNGTVLINQLPQ